MVCIREDAAEVEQVYPLDQFKAAFEHSFEIESPRKDSISVWRALIDSKNELGTALSSQGQSNCADTWQSYRSTISKVKAAAWKSPRRSTSTPCCIQKAPLATAGERAASFPSSAAIRYIASVFNPRR